MRQNTLAPSIERKQPDTFCWTLIIRRSFSAWLLEKGTSGSTMKRSTASSNFLSRSRRFLAFDLAIFPGFRWYVFFFGSGHSMSASVSTSRYRCRNSSASGGSREPPASSTARLISRRRSLICLAHFCPSCSAALSSSRR